MILHTLKNRKKGFGKGLTMQKLNEKLDLRSY